MTTSSPKLQKTKQRPEFVDSAIDVIKQNGTLFTVFAVLLIAISGISIVESPANWWVSAVSILTFFVVIFLFMNARVFLKVIAASFSTLLLSSFAFKIGSFADPNGTAGLVWMCSILFLFFSSLAFSYLVSSGKSRWGSIMISQFSAFATTYILTIGVAKTSLGVLYGLIFGIGIFLFSYKFTRASRFSKKGMPKNILTEQFINMVQDAAGENAMPSTVIEGKNSETGSVLVYRSKAYLLHPVMLETAFVPIGRKAVKLGYRDKNINPWLLNLNFVETPAWKSRGADIMTVLVDLENKNGHVPKVIGVTLPDTKNKLPIGIIPGRVFTHGTTKTAQQALAILEDEFGQYVNALTPKQLKAIQRIGASEIEED